MKATLVVFTLLVALAGGACGRSTSSPSMPHNPAEGGGMGNMPGMDGGHTGGGGGAPSLPELTSVAEGTQEISIVATDLAFQPKVLEAKAGPVKIRYENKGQAIHDFTVTGIGMLFDVNPGQTVVKAYSFAAGNYDFYCSVSGHREAGMTGKLVVS